VSPTAIVLILIAAIAHASWNLFGKQASATGAAFFIWLLAACATVIYLPVAVVTVILTHPHLTGLNWVFLGGTGLLHSGYFLFLQLGYRRGELSLAYPIGRGTGALLAAVAGITLLGERPGLVSAAGILAIIAGVVAIGLPAGRESAGDGAPVLAPVGTAAGSPAPPSPASLRSAPLSPAPLTPAPLTPAQARSRAIGFALVTGVFIGGYTLWDKYAVSNLHTPPVLQGYAGLPVMAIVFTPVVLRDTARLAQVWRTFRPQVLGAAVLSPLAYMLVLVALSFTAVSAVAPAREVSVLFGVLLGRRLLGEGHLARRLTAAAAIVAGIVAIAVG
jgi:drug/metabolite transporter (DMT)-like permease